MNGNGEVKVCVCCGGRSFNFLRVLWPSLIEEWELSDEERDYIDRQQGFHCTSCGSNLRSMVLALAMMRCYGYRGVFRDFTRTLRGRTLRVLEVNEAGSLAQFWPSRFHRRELRVFPQFDMMKMAADDESYDLVIHSDTLEHVPDPILGLSECRRVLRRGGFCCFTVPIVVGRLSRSRAGLPPSYHGQEEDSREDFTVHTEFGADAWKHCL
ncbi:class I SAM-dependent methyltransferase, partial [Singulisphaera rosea]